MLDEIAACRVEVEVVITIAFAHHHEVFRIESQVAVGFFLDVLFGFVAHHELAEGALRVGEVEVETVLVTVQSGDGQHVRVAGELDAWDIAIYIERKVHLTGDACLDVEGMYGYFRVIHTRHRILVFVSSRINAIFVERRLQTLVPWERVHRHVAFIEADVGEHGTIGAEVEGTVECEFFFVYPVRDTVQYMVELTVGSHLRFAIAEKELHEEEVVVAHESNLVAIRREQRHLLRTTIRKRFEGVVAYIEDVIYSSERTAVDGLGFCLNENLGFVRRHDVVVETLQGTIACGFDVENGSHFLTGLERILHDLLPVTADLGVMFAIEHRLDAIDAFGAVSAGGYFLQSHLLGMAYQYAQAQHHQNA